MTYTILGALTTEIPAFEGFPGLPGTATPARRVLVWRVAVQGFGRYADDPRVRAMEYEAMTTEELREKVERSSREDLSAYKAGD